jgi:acyl-CoA synthetase (AMP-forming)/AMP-acid ligase II
VFVLRRAARINARGAAILTDDGVTTWSEFAARVERMAAGLRAEGVRHGDRVAILSLNGAQYYEMLFAVIWVGAIAVPINTRFSDREIAFVLNDLDGPWLCCDEAFIAVLERIRSEVSGARGLLYMGTGAAPPPYVRIAELAAVRPDADGEDPAADDVAMIYYTGGTTGVSKGVMLTHLQIMFTAQQIAAAMKTADPLCSDSVYVHATPMFHMADGAMCFTAASVACANSFVSRFDVASFVTHANRHGVSWATLVPTMIKTLCTYLQEHDLRIPSLKGILYGAAPMPSPVLELAMRTLPGVQLFHGYGSTEALIVSILEPCYHGPEPRQRELMRSVGRPLTGVLVAVLDEQDRELPTGAVGEICVRSNAVMKGYWKRPELTERTLSGNWLHTGDAGYVDEDGFVFLVDRVKDMVISGGENIYPKEVEDALLTYRQIDECAVIGLPHETWGEIVHAVIHLRSGAAPSPGELDRHCRQLIAGYKVPKSWEFISEQLPRTSLGKIDKVSIRAARHKPALR